SHHGVTETRRKSENKKKQEIAFLCDSVPPWWIDILETRQAASLRRRPFLFLLHPHNGDFRETLLEGRRLQLTRHLAHDIFGDRTATALVAFQTNLKRDVEEHALHIVAVILGQLDPAMAVVGRKVRRIHVVHGTARNQPRLQHRSQVRKHQILKALLLRVIEKKFSQQIARKRMNIVPLEPRTLARSRQPDGQDYRSLAGAGGNRR